MKVKKNNLTDGIKEKSVQRANFLPSAGPLLTSHRKTVLRDRDTWQPDINVKLNNDSLSAVRISNGSMSKSFCSPCPARATAGYADSQAATCTPPSKPGDRARRMPVGTHPDPHDPQRRRTVRHVVNACLGTRLLLENIHN